MRNHEGELDWLSVFVWILVVFLTSGFWTLVGLAIAGQL